MSPRLHATNILYMPRPLSISCDVGLLFHSIHALIPFQCEPRLTISTLASIAHVTLELHKLLLESYFGHFARIGPLLNHGASIPCWKFSTSIASSSVRTSFSVKCTKNHWMKLIWCQRHDRIFMIAFIVTKKFLMLRVTNTIYIYHDFFQYLVIWDYFFILLMQSLHSNASHI